MCQQMASTHGDIGESKETVGHIINEHDKFTETAKVRGAEGKREGGKEGGGLFCMKLHQNWRAHQTDDSMV